MTANFEKIGNRLELHTLFMTSSWKNHTLVSGSSLYRQYRGIPPWAVPKIEAS